MAGLSGRGGRDNPRMKFLARLGAPMCLAGGLAACAPALDWRDVRPAGTRLQLQFPCRPVAQQRTVVLAGAAVPMTLQACDADGHTFALALADVGDPARVSPALTELAAGAARNIGALARPGRTLELPGATPNAGNQRIALQGRRPDGRAAQVSAALFAHGTTVFQATVLAEVPAAEAVEIFLASLRLAP